ncbi:MAG: hypothetical protein ACFFDT_24075, partial [Candidatus Hodarchaeota archaeon]
MMAIIDFLMNPMMFGIIFVFVLSMVIVFIIRRRGGSLSGKTISVFRPRDKRIFDIPVSEETDEWLICRKIGNMGVERRFLKAGPGWTYTSGAVRFLGLEGKGYTVILNEGEEKEVTLLNALKSLWGDAYNSAPQKLREIVENHTFGITVIPTKVEGDEQYTVSSENIDKENIKDAMEVLGKKL